jgi:hypothetical protein
MILTREVARLKNIPSIYRWQHLKKRGGELVVTHNSEPSYGEETETI